MNKQFSLRSYQQSQLEFLISQSENTCIQSPTGSGKSIVIEAYIQHLLEQGKTRIAVITPSQELVRNIKEYFGSLATMAFSGETPNIFAPIFITTFQSAGKYMKLYDPEHYISDECHLSVCQTWQNALIPGIRHDGFTATPNRLDGRPLRENFQHLYKSPSIQWFIDQKYLAPFKLTICDYPEFSDSKSDNLGNQQEVFGSAPEIAKTVEIFMQKSRKEKSLFFVTGVEHGMQLQEKLEKYGIDASFVDSKTPKRVRDKCFQEFKYGNKQALININLFTTGIDVPECSSVFACRFTYSPTLHFQIAGRGWRYMPGKVFKYFDLAGNCYYHGSPTMPYSWSLNGDKSPRGTNKESLFYRCSKCFTELILRKDVKGNEIQEMICPQCGQNNFLYPKIRLGDVGKELTEKTFRLLKMPPTIRPMVAHVVSIERSSKLSVIEKVAAICELDAPIKLKRMSLKRLGVDSRSIKLFTEG